MEGRTEGRTESNQRRGSRSYDTRRRQQREGKQNANGIKNQLRNQESKSRRMAKEKGERIGGQGQVTDALQGVRLRCARPQGQEWKRCMESGLASPRRSGMLRIELDEQAGLIVGVLKRAQARGVEGA